MNRTIASLACATGVLLGTALSASATTLTTFTDRATFEAAATNLLFENFNRVLDTPSFANTPLTVGDLTLETSGPRVQGGERNAIDQPPAQFDVFDVDGTTLANVLLDGPGQTFTISFAFLVSSFFADFGGLNTNLPGPQTEIVVNGSVTSPQPQFGIRGFGFISDTAFDTVTFRHRANDGFGMDNIAYGRAAPVSPVPVPASLALMVISLGGIAMVGRRQKPQA